MIIALIPAHNEEDCIAQAIHGLKNQTVPLNTIVVVADNCTDRTEEIAFAEGVNVFRTQGNKCKKAGALNQALESIIPMFDDDTLILVTDADTSVAPSFAETAVATFNDKPNTGAVGGIFYGDPGGGLLGQLQRNEYTRYAREIDRKNGRCTVLTGTATMFSAGSLRAVRAARRGQRLPVGGGDSYYSLASLTEDDEMTKAMKTLGYRPLSPTGCEVTTEVMETIPKLWHQRKRWQRGAVENIASYGITRVTLPYLLKQIAMGAGAACFTLYCVLSLIALFTSGLHVQTFWLALGGLFVLERCVTVRRAGVRAVLLALVMVPEMLYDIFINAVYVVALFGFIFKSEERWIPT